MNGVHIYDIYDINYLKLFESFDKIDLEIVEDEIVWWLDTRQAESVSIGEYIRIYTFKDLRELDSARESLEKRGYRSYKSGVERIGHPNIHRRFEGQDCLIIFRPELEEFLDDKLLDSEVYPYRNNKDLLIWKKEGEVRANQVEQEIFFVKYDGIWSVFRNQYSMENFDIKVFIRGWLEERYKCSPKFLRSLSSLIL